MEEVSAEVLESVMKNGLILIRTGKTIKYYQSGGGRESERGGIEILCKKEDAENMIHSLKKYY